MPSPLPTSSFLAVGGSCSLMRQETEINGGGPPQAACAITRKRVGEAGKTPELFFLPICFTWKGEQGKVQMISLLIMIISSSSMTENIHIRAGGKRRGHVRALPFHHCLSLWSSACTEQLVTQQPLAWAEFASPHSKFQTLFQCRDFRHDNFLKSVPSQI